MRTKISFATFVCVAGSIGLFSVNMAHAALDSNEASESKEANESRRELYSADGRMVALAQEHSKKTLKIKIDREVVMADDLMLKGKYSDAADLYKEVVNKNPKNVPATVGYGMALSKQFKLDAANEQFDKALAIDPKNAMAYSGKAMTLFNSLQSSSNTVIKNKDNLLKQAESTCQQGLAIDPGMPEAHYTLGMIYKEEGRLPEATNEFQEATKIDPQYSEAFAGLGIAKLMQNDLTGAQTAFKQAITLNSGNSTAHYGLGKCYVKQGMNDQAIKELNTSLYQNKNSAPARLAIGEAYSAQGNTVAAISNFQESIRIKPENPDAYMHIADIREQRGDLEHSIAELRSGLEMSPNDPGLHSRIADESLHLEKLDDAIKEYTTVLNSNPQDANAAKGLTRAYYMKANKEATGAFFVSNEYESAKAMLDKAVKMNPNDMELRLAQAKLRSLSGEKIDLNTVGAPTNDGERMAYAEALLAQNNYKDADAQMNMVIANANTPKQAFAVADLALMIKDLPSADAAYKKAGSFPGNEERVKRGMDQLAKAKDDARQNLTLANDLAKRKQLQSAIDKYHAAIFGNPKVNDSHRGLAETLERLSPQESKDLRESVIQYKAYIALTPDIPPKDLEKLNKHITMLENKAFKLEQKEKEQGSKPRK
jgi:tetratricopeptide (TPR) repeat protein